MHGHRNRQWQQKWPCLWPAAVSPGEGGTWLMAQKGTSCLYLSFPFSHPPKETTATYTLTLEKQDLWWPAVLTRMAHVTFDGTKWTRPYPQFRGRLCCCTFYQWWHNSLCGFLESHCTALAACAPSLHPPFSPNPRKICFPVPLSSSFGLRLACGDVFSSLTLHDLGPFFTSSVIILVLMVRGGNVHSDLGLKA